MRRLRVDVVVVGGGPVGAVAARTAAEAGAEVLLLERNRQVGRPVQCTGLVSTRTLEAAGVMQHSHVCRSHAPNSSSQAHGDAGPGPGPGVGLTDSGARIVLREVRGAFVYGPDGRELAIASRGTMAYVIDRAEFDRLLIERAAAAGVQVRTGVRAVGLAGNVLRLRATGPVPDVSETASWDGKDSKNQEGELEVEAKVIIGADGPYSRIREWAGLPPPRKLLYGVQVVVPYRPKREDFVEVLLGRGIAPNFFAWVVPASAGRARIGLATDDGQLAKRLLAKLLQSRGIRERDILEFQGGTIPIGPTRRTVKGNVLIVGDAAGQAKPTSGGGIYTGITCAKIAGEVAARAVIQNNPALLTEYEARWRACLEGELRFGMLAHYILSRLSDAELARLLAAIADPDILKIIAVYGDIDYPSKLVRHLLGEPRLWTRFASLLPPLLLRRLQRAFPAYIPPSSSLSSFSPSSSSSLPAPAPAPSSDPGPWPM